jgi:hypothetical protein
MQGVGVEKVGDIFCENATGKAMIVGYGMREMG